MFLSFFFFFQAEDGIRDIGVTGVQTCALPILLLAMEGAHRAPGAMANNALLAALESCHEERTLLGHEGEVLSAAFSPDGRQILTASKADGTVRLWDAATGKVQTQLPMRAYHLQAAVLSPDGQRLATFYDGSMTWFLRDGTQRRYSDQVVR